VRYAVQSDFGRILGKDEVMVFLGFIMVWGNE
jgi:hypothetical protein